MRSIRMLGIAVVAAMGAMALLGASSAPAAIHQCKANETPCAAGNIVALPAPMEAALHAGTEQVIKAGFSEFKCQESRFGGELEKEEITAGGIQQLVGKIAKFEDLKCHAFGGLVSCTITPLQLPWRVHFTQKAPEEQGNGNFYIGPEPPSTGEQPGWKMVCGSTECTYKVKETQPEHAGEWAKLQFKGGNPAQIIANQVELKLVPPSSSSCANPGFWSATYDLIKPNPEWLDS